MVATAAVVVLLGVVCAIFLWHVHVCVHESVCLCMRDKRQGEGEWANEWRRKEKRKESRTMWRPDLYCMPSKRAQCALTCSFKSNSIQLFSGGIFTLIFVFHPLTFRKFFFPRNSWYPFQHHAAVDWKCLCVCVGKLKIGSRLLMMTTDGYVFFAFVFIICHRRLGDFSFLFHLASKKMELFNGPSGDSAPVRPIFIT